MKSSEEKKSRFTFFKKNKKSAELSVDSDTKSDSKVSENGSIKSGAGFNRRNKTFNPFKSVRKAVNKYRSTRRPAAEVVAPPPAIIEPEPIDTEKLEELKQEVSVVQDIRKNRPKGPQGRKRRSVRPASTVDGSEVGTPVVANLEDLLKEGEQTTVCQTNGLVNGDSLSGETEICKSEVQAPSSPDKTEDDIKSPDPPSSDLVKSDVGNLASSAQESGDAKETETEKDAESTVLEKEISVEGDLATSALGSPSLSTAIEES